MVRIDRIGETERTVKSAFSTTAPQRARICAIILALFVAASTFNAFRKDVSQGFDELAHASYVAHVQSTGESWPDLNRLRMLDPITFRFTNTRNYLSHPAPYYLFLAKLGPRLENAPSSILAHRLLNVLLAAIGFGALLTISIVIPLNKISLYAYLVPLATIPVLAPLAGAINNDNLALAGGGVATLACLQAASRTTPASLCAAVASIVLASWAKMTALLLIGGLGVGVFAWLLIRGRFDYRWTPVVLLGAAFAVAPYFVLAIEYGTPTPSPIGHIEMIRSGAKSVGWDTAARLTPRAYALHFAVEFVEQWMPSLGPRSLVNRLALAIPLLMIVLGFAGVIIAAKKIWQRVEQPIDVLIVSGALAMGVTLTIHVVFSYALHIESGWLTVAYPRYYLPLAAIVPLATLTLMRYAKGGKPIIASFLIGGPFVFAVLGASLF